MLRQSGWQQSTVILFALARGPSHDDLLRAHSPRADKQDAHMAVAQRLIKLYGRVSGEVKIKISEWCDTGDFFFFEITL